MKEGAREESTPDQNQLTTIDCVSFDEGYKMVT